MQVSFFFFSLPPQNNQQQYFKHIPFIKKNIYCTVIPINKVSVKSKSDIFYVQHKTIVRSTG